MMSKREINTTNPSNLFISSCKYFLTPKANNFKAISKMNEIVKIKLNS